MIMNLNLSVNTSKLLQNYKYSVSKGGGKRLKTDFYVGKIYLYQCKGRHDLFVTR